MSQVQSLLETLTQQGINLWIDGDQLRYSGPRALLTPERLSQLKQHKSALLQGLATTTYKPAREQQAAWVAYQAASRKAAHHVTFAAHLHGRLDKLAFERAWQTLGRRHATLRTTYHEELHARLATQSNGSRAHEPALLVTVHGGQRLTLTYIDAQAWHEEEVQAQLAVHQAHPFDLTQGPLLRVVLFSRAAYEQILLVTAPRVALDDSSLARLLDEFGQLYSAAQKGVSVTLPALAATPEQVAVWQASQPLNAALDWDERPEMADEELVLNLPLDYPRQVEQGRCTAQQAFELAPDLVSQLNQLATNTETVLETVLLTAFQVLLHRYTGQNNLLVGISLQPSDHPNFGDLVGGFTTDYALHTDLAAHSGNPQHFTVLLRRTHRHLQAARTGQAPTPTTSWQVAFAKHRYSRARHESEAVAWGKLGVTPLTLQHTSDAVELKLELAEVDGNIMGTFYYRPDLLAPETLTRMVDHYRTLLNAIVVEPAQSVATMPLLTLNERHRILVEWNDTKTDFPKDKCIHHLFEEQVERTPNAVALVFNDQYLTYRELNQQANQLAHYLQSLGVGPERLVGICVERGIRMVVGLLAILKAGGAYVPLDVTYPEERLAFMLADTNISIVLTEEKLLSKKQDSLSTLCLDIIRDMLATLPVKNLTSTVLADNLAYIMYTSGSTGQPKGVCVTQRNVVRLVQNTNFAQLSEHEVLLQNSPISFDASTLEIWGALLNGARLVVMPPQQPTLSELGQAIRQHQITTLWLTAGLFHLMVDERLEDLRPLRQLLAGGDVLSVPHVQKVLANLPNCQLINGYGPTENTTFTCSFPMKDVEQVGTSVSIGRPIANTQVYILNEALQPVPVGVAGELYAGGDGVAQGYYNRPQLTSEKFIRNPFGDGQLYKSGDLACWLPDGNIEFLGRMDNQVKIRGFRIELGEIETVLTEHPKVQEAVVVAQKRTSGYKRLAAYVVPKQTQQTGIELWPSIPEHDVYDDLIYYTLTSDELRNHSYKVAINQVVKDKTVVEIGTGQDALLAVFCAEAGAKKVYGIEIDFEAARRAIARIQELGLEDKIEVIHGDATTVQLPELVDVCISGIVGPIGGGQGAAVLINDAHRFLKSYGLMIPERCFTKIAAVTLPDEIRHQPKFTKLSGTYVQKIFDKVGHPFDLRLCIRKFPKSNLLSNIELFEELDFTKFINLESSHEITLTIDKKGKFDGFLVWMELHLIKGEVIDILEGDYAPMPVYFPIFEPEIEVSVGDVIKATCTRTLSDNQLNPDYIMGGFLKKKDGQIYKFTHCSYHHKALFKQTSFYKRLFAADNTVPNANSIASMAPRSTPSSLVPKLRQYMSLNTRQQKKQIGPQESKVTSQQSLQTFLSTEGSFEVKLRHHLAKKLPDYMVPSSYVLLDALPLTANGKVNRQALPLPDLARKKSRNGPVPTTSLEKEVAAIMQDMLGKTVGLHDHFFAQGGDSIMAILLISRLRNRFSIEYPLRDFFETPTVERVAKFIERVRQATQSLQDISAAMPGDREEGEL